MDYNLHMTTQLDNAIVGKKLGLGILKTKFLNTIVAQPYVCNSHIISTGHLH